MGRGNSRRASQPKKEREGSKSIDPRFEKLTRIVHLEVSKPKFLKKRNIQNSVENGCFSSYYYRQLGWKGGVASALRISVVAILLFFFATLFCAKTEGSSLTWKMEREEGEVEIGVLDSRIFAKKKYFFFFYELLSVFHRRFALTHHDYYCPQNFPASGHKKNSKKKSLWGNFNNGKGGFLPFTSSFKR